MGDSTLAYLHVLQQPTTPQMLQNQIELVSKSVLSADSSKSRLESSAKLFTCRLTAVEGQSVVARTKAAVCPAVAISTPDASNRV